MFSNKVTDTETSSSEDLLQSLSICSQEWYTAVLAELERRGEPYKPGLGRVSGLDDVPVAPYPTRDSPWKSAPGTLARHDEEEEAIHGVN
jgi:hypothetical protein